MALKGTATIELTNADGSKKEYRHDNMITNAPASMLTSRRGEMAPLFKIVSNGANYMQAMFGGILLFNDTLNSDANDFFLPSLKVTGYASQDAYAGLDAARGSFNSLESGLQKDGSYRFVWDFATSQANGTIKSLGLCPDMMGKIGLSQTTVSSERKSFEIKNRLTAPFDADGHMLPSSGSTADSRNYNYYVVAVVNDIAYAFDTDNVSLVESGSDTSKFIKNNGGILKLYRFKLGDKNVGAANVVGMATYIDCVDVTLPTDLVESLWQSTYRNRHTSLCSFFDCTTNKLIVFPCRFNEVLQANGTVKYVDIDLSDNMKVTSYTFTNNTAGSIDPNGDVLGIGRPAVKIVVLKNHVLTVSTSEGKTKFFSSKRVDNTQVKEIKRQDGSEYTVPSGTSFQVLFIRKNIVVIQYCTENNNYNYDRGVYVAIDLEAGIIQNTNIDKLSIGASIDIGDDILFPQTYAYLTYMYTFNPFILCTKNNLDSPVTKTSSQTMKITYTLTESEG